MFDWDAPDVFIPVIQKKKKVKTIKKLNEKSSPVVFILWGNNARSKKELITNPVHHIIESVHPSPLSASRGFFGGRYFSRTNEYLTGDNLTPIDWEIKDRFEIKE